MIKPLRPAVPSTDGTAVDSASSTRVDADRTPASTPEDGPLATSGAAPDRLPRQRTPEKGEDAASADTTAPKPADTTDAPPAAGENDPASPETGSATSADGNPDGTATEAPVGRRRRTPFAHAVRLPSPKVVARRTATATRDWSRRPSGRLTLPGLLLLVLVAGTVAAGAVLVPAIARSPRTTAVSATPTDLASTVPVDGQLPTLPGNPIGGGYGQPVPQPPAGRPADALAAWAQQTGAKVGIPATAMQAYGYAELVVSQTNRSCGLTWTTLAAIGYVESRHGAANGATLNPDGRVIPAIIGLPLDGQGGRQKIADTDAGQYDGDRVFDRAIGPMQFIPSTWKEIGADADNDGQKDPQDLDDAALAAANYLCKGGRNLSVPGDWWNAILSYNDVRRYAQDVFDRANQYGVASRG